MVASDSADSFDTVILHPTARRYFGDPPYNNVGLWDRQAADQPQACEHLMDRLLERLPKRPAAILDVACGLGATTDRIARSFPDCSVVGINISQRQIEYAQNRFPKLDLRVMDATRLSFEPETFGAVVCVEAASFFGSRSSFFEQAHRVLVPGGVLAMTDVLFLEQPPFEHLIGSLEQEPVNSPEEYSRLCARSGLRVETILDKREVTWYSWCGHMMKWADRHGCSELREAAAVFAKTRVAYLFIFACKDV